MLKPGSRGGRRVVVGVRGWWSRTSVGGGGEGWEWDEEEGGEGGGRAGKKRKLNVE